MLREALAAIEATDREVEAARAVSEARGSSYCRYVLAREELEDSKKALDDVTEAATQAFLVNAAAHDVRHGIHRTELRLASRRSATVTEALPWLLVLAALATGEIRGYRDKELVDVIRVGEVVSALCCGSYGREDNTLVVVTRSGGLLVKMLPRSAAFDTADRAGGPPPEQDVPLAIPKKTRMYLEQTDRERELAPRMHRQFQKDIVKLQLTAAKAYAGLLKKGELAGGAGGSPGANGDEGTVELNATVRGLGPYFHLVLELRAVGASALLQVPVCVTFDESTYRMPRALCRVPALCPGVTIRVIFEIECIDENAAAQDVTIVVMPPVKPSEEVAESTTDVAPLVASKLTMPQSELLET